MRSEGVVTIALNKADFVGVVTGGMANWEFHERARRCDWPLGYTFWRNEDDIIAHRDGVHSDDLRFRSRDVTQYVEPWRAVWMEDGSFVKPRYAGNKDGNIDTSFQRTGRVGFGSFYAEGQGNCDSLDDFGKERPWSFYYVKSCPKLTSPVYLKRERYWARVPVDGIGAMFARLSEGTEYQITTTYSQGISIENSYGYASTVSASVEGGLEYVGVVKAAVEESIEHSFQVSTTINEETEVSHSETVYGREGKTVVFMLWELVEEYSVVDEDGDPYTDPKYYFKANTGSATVRGVALALEATAFDAR